MTAHPSQKSTSQNILFVLSGSRGDIQPAVSLGLELQKRGHTVTFLCTPSLTTFARTAGLQSVLPAGINIGDVTDRARSTLASKNPIAIAKLAAHFLKHSVDDLHQDLTNYYFSHDNTQCSADMDHPGLTQPTLLIVNPMCQRQGTSLAEKWNIPLVVLRYAPIFHNSYSGWPHKLTRRAPKWIKKKSWHIQEWFDFLMYGHWENAFRRRLGLTPRFHPFTRYLRDNSVPQLQLCDPKVVPDIAAEWAGTNKIFVGYLDLPASARRRLDEPDTLPTDLDHWLSSGSAPLFVSFGSMPVSNPARLVGTIISAARRRNLRVLFSGFDGFTNVSDDEPQATPTVGNKNHGETNDVYFTGAVNQTTVLPRCCAAVHHGGAGTTAASLRSGNPTMIYAFGFEQPFWASCIENLGVGVGSSLSHLTDEHFGDDLDRALSSPVRDAAQAFAAEMTSPDQALSTAIRLIENEAS
ncbi:glycosyltransferase [Corynebacterium pseudokroppenstedtii]|uniref:Glycosyltransferase n=1 Tax=Corynebacterium pseudokroppenstedtii TaxID=2804917 RepID=A0AAU0Q0P2_9CORY|nr:glycosyltransferase [Corynebacterium pseudokroppenstedtii]MBY0791230.1 glycosyltransferase family 1 protein [Corynebacterium pseudokroppenstedtii]MCF6793472.1 glycosyltransferase [Corynebacterium pseudokroppenstedtii]MCF8702900.1 glycosyltransferase [Corynebacterium pseudokroppenstedtii]MCG2636501.1 glycosyltransferase [Corynebacterium pseudokroppenstedtii]